MSRNKQRIQVFISLVAVFFLLTLVKGNLAIVGSDRLYNHYQYDLAKWQYRISDLLQPKTLEPVETSSVDSSIEENLISVWVESDRQEREYGYTDWQDIDRQRAVIPAIFDSPAEFSGDYALVKFRGKYGIIDRQGKAKTTFIYESPGFVVNLERGQIFLTQNDLQGVVDLEGNVLIPAKFDKIKFSLTLTDNSKPERNISRITTHAVVTKNGKKGIVDLQGNTSVAVKYDAIDPALFGRDYIIVTKNKHKGILNLQGDRVIPIEYDQINYYAKDSDLDYIIVSKNNRQGILDLQGNTVIPLEYDSINPSIIDRGQAIAIKSGKEGIIDLQNNTLIPFKYNSIDPSIIERGYAVATKNEKQGVIDLNNKIIVPFEYDRLESGIVDRGYAIAAKNGKEGLLGIDNEAIIPFEFLGIDPRVNDRHTNLKYSILSKGKYKGVMDIKGDILLPFAYDEVNEIIVEQIDNWRSYNPQNNMYVVTLNNRQGVINAEGQAIVPIEYDRIEISEDDLPIYTVTLNDREGVIDSEGNTLIPLVNGKIENYGTEGYAIVTRNNHQGVVGLEGETLIPFQYDEINYIDLNLGYVIATNKGFQGAIDFEGKTLLPFKYNSIGNIISNSGGDTIANRIYYSNTRDDKSSHFLLATKGQSTELFNLQQQSVVLSGIEQITFFLPSQNYVQITKEGKQGIADIQGNIIIPFEYDTIYTPNKIDRYSVFTATNGKQGIVDYHFGRQIIPPKYDSIDYFNPEEGYAIVSQGKERGIHEGMTDSFTPIEYNAIEQISAEEYYYLASNTDNKDITIIKDGVALLLSDRVNNRLLLVDFGSAKIDYAVVSQDNKQGVVSILDGKVIVPIEYEKIDYNGDTPYAIASKQGQNGILNLKNNAFTVIKSDKLDGSLLARGYVIFTSHGKEGIADLSGKIIIPAKYNIPSDSTLETTYIKLINDTYLIAGKNKQIGLINLQTKKFFALDYDLILNSRYRLYLEPSYLVAIEDKKQGIIDLQGNLVVPLQEGRIISYRDGIVLREKGTGFDRQISLDDDNDKTTNTVLEKRNIANDNFFTLNVDGKYSPFHCVIDRQGKLLYRSQHHNWGARDKIDNLCRSFVGIEVDNTAIKENPRPTELGSYDYHFRSGLMRVKVNNKWGFANKKGDFVIYPQFDSVGEFSNGLAAVKINGKYGYINMAGEIAIAPQFDYAEAFSGNFAKVIENKRNNFIDRTGKTILNTGNYPKVPPESIPEN